MGEVVCRDSTCKQKMRTTSKTEKVKVSGGTSDKAGAPKTSATPRSNGSRMADPHKDATAMVVDKTDGADKTVKKRKASRRGKGGKTSQKERHDGSDMAANLDPTKTKRVKTTTPTLPEPVKLSVVSPAQAQNKKKKEVAKKKTKKPGVCYAFQNGECDRGEKCIYTHTTSDVSREKGTKGTKGAKTAEQKRKAEATAASISGVVKLSKEVIPGTAYVRKIPPIATKTTVTEALEKFGEVTSCRLVMDKETKESNGTAFVDFADELSVKKAVAACQSYKRGKGNGVPCAGSRLQIDPALTATGLSAIVNGTTARSSMKAKKQKKEEVRKNKVCRDFLKGKCQRGDECKFEHPEKVEESITKKKICFAFKKGQCNRGDRCLFSHATGTSIMAQQSKVFKTPFGGANDRKPQRQTYNETQQTAPSVRAKNTKKDQVCHAFQRGECDRGESCRFSHIK